jgi:hypothetical protein
MKRQIDLTLPNGREISAYRKKEIWWIDVSEPNGPKYQFEASEYLHFMWKENTSYSKSDIISMIKQRNSIIIE